MNAFTLNTSSSVPALARVDSPDGVALEVYGGFDAYSSDLLVSALCKSKGLLYSNEEAKMLAEECNEDEGLEFDGPNYAEGLLRLTGIASRTDTPQPAAMALAHVYVEANCGHHPDLGHILKLHLSIGAGHIHRMGVGLGLQTLLGREMLNQVLSLIQVFQSTCPEDLTVMWSFEESLAACENLDLRTSLHRGLMGALYAPLLHVTEDSVI